MPCVPDGWPHRLQLLDRDRLFFRSGKQRPIRWGVPSAASPWGPGTDRGRCVAIQDARWPLQYTRDLAERSEAKGGKHWVFGGFADIVF